MINIFCDFIIVNECDICQTFAELARKQRPHDKGLTVQENTSYIRM